MYPIEIQYRLRKKGLRQQDFVRKGQSAQLISQVVYRITKSRPVEEDLAEALGHPACAKDASTPTGHRITPRPGLQFPACLTRSALAGRPSTEGFRFVLREGLAPHEGNRASIFAGSPRP